MFINSKNYVWRRENNFTQNKYNKLQKIRLKISAFVAKNKCKSANLGSSTVQLQVVDQIDIPSSKLIIKTYFYII